MFYSFVALFQCPVARGCMFFKSESPLGGGGGGAEGG